MQKFYALVKIRLKIFTRLVASIGELFKNKINSEEMAEVYTL